jgi:hypothetical protein
MADAMRHADVDALLARVLDLAAPPEREQLNSARSAENEVRELRQLDGTASLEVAFGRIKAGLPLRGWARLRGSHQNGDMSGDPVSRTRTSWAWHCIHSPKRGTRSGSTSRDNRDMQNWTVSSFAEAIDLANRLREKGTYNLFRGQKRNWLVSSSASRLSGQERDSARERLNRFDMWIQTTAGLEHYRDDASASMAVAQHYGIPTPYIDFTTNPEVAAFFASDGYSGSDPAVLICLNEQDFLSIVLSLLGIDEQFDRFLRTLTFGRPATPNLWRMEAQECVFLNCQLEGSIETAVYNMDRILICNAPDGGHIDRDRIYPSRKSDLETLLDQFFSLEYRLPGWRMFNRFAHDGTFRATDQVPDPGDYYLRQNASQHPSWLASDNTKWVEGRVAEVLAPNVKASLLIDVDSVMQASESVDIIAEQIAGAIESGSLCRNKPEAFALRGEPYSETVDLTVASRALAALWDGVRRLPYSDRQIATSMARFICIATLEKGESELIEAPIHVEFGASDGSYARALVGRKRLADAFRSDLPTLVKESYLPQIKDNPAVALLWIPDPQLLFSFDEFVDLLVHDVLPSQMVRSSPQRGRFFSPWRISKFGLA